MFNRLVLVVLLAAAPALAREPEPAPVDNTAQAKALNTAGFKLYKAKKYGEAIESFKAAIAADSKHALAHYNLAATYGLLRKAKRVCEFDAYRSAVLEPLQQAIALDPGRKARAKKDADFDAVRDTVRYQESVMDRPLSDPKNVPAVLDAVRFFAQSQGIYGPLYTFDFLPRGRVSIQRMVLDDASGTPKQLVTKGRYKVEGRTVKLTLDQKLGEATQYEGTLDEKGVLTFPAPFGQLTDDDDECSA